jgi:PPM family protein phosphatase
MVTGFRYASRAMVGAREGQEDSCQFASIPGTESGTVPLERRIATRPETLLAVLADGMGGHVGGAEASTIACATFVSAYQAESGSERSRLAGALDSANRAIRAALQHDRALKGMGCTCVGATFTDEGLAWVSVGDSPLLLFRDHKLYQLNEDHSLAPLLDKLVANGEMTLAEAESDPRRHYLRAALTGDGIEMVDLSTTVLALRQGDLVLLASDGIEVLSHAEMADILAARSADDPEAVVVALLAAVSAKGAANQDNVTVMAVKPAFDPAASPLSTG